MTRFRALASCFAVKAFITIRLAAWHINAFEDLETGQPLVRTGPTRFVGSLFWLVPGTAYEVRVVVDETLDSDGEEIFRDRYIAVPGLGLERVELCVDARVEGGGYFTVVDAGSTATIFVDAKLNLTVKPHITADGSVIMIRWHDSERISWYMVDLEAYLEFSNEVPD